jgi:hypothetical protein
MTDLGEAGHLTDIHDGAEISVGDKGNFAVIDGGKILKFRDKCLISLSQSVGKITVHFEKGDYIVIRQKGRFNFKRQAAALMGWMDPGGNKLFKSRF